MLRLYKYIKTFGNYTKKELKDLFNNHEILVNDEFKNLSYLVRDNDVVKVKGNVIKPKQYNYFAYNKPIGYICTNDLGNENSVIKHLNYNDKYFCVGRLDKLSHGLIIITNDGKFAHDVLDSKNEITKEYEVILKDKITCDFIEKMSESILIKGKETIPAKIIKLDDYRINVTLFEGRYHQVRKLVINSGNKVVDLKRIRIGKLYINNLQNDEIISIKKEDVI